MYSRAEAEFPDYLMTLLLFENFNKFSVFFERERGG